MRASKPVQVREPEPELVSAVEPLALAQVWEPESVQPLQLVSAVEQLELALGLQLELELVSAVEPPLVREPARQQELAAALEQARELRVSRQQEQQQHRLQAAAQEQLPYLPALPMKAPCWGAPAW